MTQHIGSLTSKLSLHWVSILLYLENSVHVTRLSITLKPLGNAYRAAQNLPNHDWNAYFQVLLVQVDYNLFTNKPVLFFIWDLFGQTVSFIIMFLQLQLIIFISMQMQLTSSSYLPSCFFHHYNCIDVSSVFASFC